jgi:micrococcal nuclease
VPPFSPAVRQIAALLVLLVGIGAGWLALRADDKTARSAHGLVIGVVDGDTIDVRIGGSRERVRVLGIDTPEAGACFAQQATRETRRLALGQAVELHGDPSQPTRDRFGRRLAYVVLPDGRDLGFQLIAGGLARSFVVGEPFERLETYRRAEIFGRRRAPSIWRCAAASGLDSPRGWQIVI